MMDRQAYDQLDRQLTKEERKEMFQEYAKTKDQELRDILIEEHLYIAEILSKKYANRGIDYDDIFQVASIGLIYGVERYDPSKGYEFSSFATPTIIGEIKNTFETRVGLSGSPEGFKSFQKKSTTPRLPWLKNIKELPQSRILPII
ncbi:sigma-70 region 2 [Peptoniphilus sp. oral taxon 375 str. F0436]|nr:sigma-70 region 2 [Peptoniphilus sp. oral taxon 375 str. F0436]